MRVRKRLSSRTRPVARVSSRTGSQAAPSTLRKSVRISRLDTVAPNPQASLIGARLRISARTISRSASSTQSRPVRWRNAASPSMSRFPGWGTKVSTMAGRPSMSSRPSPRKSTARG